MGNDRIVAKVGRRKGIGSLVGPEVSVYDSIIYSMSCT